MKMPTTLDIRKACRAATPLVAGVQTYTDKLAGNYSRVAYLMYSCSETDVDAIAIVANSILIEDGFEPVVASIRSYACYGSSYMKLVGRGVRA